MNAQWLYAWRVGHVTRKCGSSPVNDMMMPSSRQRPMIIAINWNKIIDRHMSMLPSQLTVNKHRERCNDLFSSLWLSFPIVGLSTQPCIWIPATFHPGWADHCCKRTPPVKRTEATCLWFAWTTVLCGAANGPHDDFSVHNRRRALLDEVLHDQHGKCRF